MPTPGVAYLAGALDFDLGVVLSASHNPYGDNGIKVFSGRGEKFGEAEERAVEAVMADPSLVRRRRRRDAASTRGDFVDAYLEHVRRLLPIAGPLAGARIARRHGQRRDDDDGDAAVRARSGSTSSRSATSRTAATSISRADRRIRRGSPRRSSPSSCRLGVAFDGDGDRAIFVDHRGHVVDGDAVLLMLALALSARRAG